MRLKNHLDPGLTFVKLQATDKSTLLRLLTDKAAEHVPGIDSADLLRRLEERESAATTGIGNGVAIPHTTVMGLEKTICLLAQIPAGVEFDSIDGRPVHFVFMLLSPAESVWTHLRHLARISRIASSDDFIRNVVAAPDPEAVVELVAREDGKHVD
jgi:PTS system nitrogen regulatory IIA component